MHKVRRTAGGLEKLVLLVNRNYKGGFSMLFKAFLSESLTAFIQVYKPLNQVSFKKRSCFNKVV